MTAGSDKGEGRRKSAFWVCFLLLLALTGSGAAWAGVESIAVGKLAVYPDTAEKRALAESLVRKAALLAERTYGQFIHVSYGTSGERAQYLLELNAVFQDAGEALSVTLRPVSGGAAEQSFTITGKLRPEQASYLANVIFFLWSAFHGYLAEGMGEPAELVDEISAEAVARSALPEMPAMLVPTSAAVTGNGSLLVGFSMICVELDSNFRILGQPGRSLYEEGDYAYAYGVAVTPAGTIFLKPGMGREIYRLLPGVEQPQRWRLGSDLFGPFAALPDGSAVIVDIAKRQAFRVMERKTQSLDLFSGPYSFISAMAVGPEGTLWVYDAQERRLRIHGSDGRLIDGIIPVIDPSLGVTPLALAVRADGSFLLYSSPGELWSFSRLGLPLWRLAALQGWEAQESLPQAAALAADSRQGLIYLADQTGRRILKLQDTAYSRRNGISNLIEEQLIALNRAQRREPNNPEPSAQKALLYERLSAFEMARRQWQRVMEIDPYHAQGQEKLKALELAILTGNARTLRARTLQTLENVGPETARVAYTRTLQLYERILALNPLDEGIREEMKELKARFQAREAAARAPQATLSITRISVQNLFPSLLQHYRRFPVARLEVENISAKELASLQASILIKRFMDFPSESAELPRLAPGQKSELQLPVILNTDVLELEEDLPVQARIELTYRADAQPQSLSRVAPLTVYRRTALSWDDSGKLASFITPNDETVTRFSHRALGSAGAEPGWRVSALLLRAARICDALGAYGIEYIEDPDSPISKVLGKEQAVDTVRLPRTTLLIRSGDCDDSTALLASLLESSGVGTALMTSPGHVFLAFNSGEPAENAWLYAAGASASGLEVIAQGGTLWIPVETTVLRKGFLAAWQEASRLYREHGSAGRIEFLPLQGLRDLYPPIPITGSGFSVIEPVPAEIDALYRGTLRSLEASLYEARLVELIREAGSLEGRKRLKIQNRIGILHALFGRDREAEKAFVESAQADPGYTAPLINLANLRLSRGELGGAKEALLRAVKQKPDSAAAHLLLAQLYYLEKEGGKAAEHFRLAQAGDPALAGRYTYLADLSSGKGGGQPDQVRAGTGRETPGPWSEE